MTKTTKTVAIVIGAVILINVAAYLYTSRAAAQPVTGDDGGPTR